MARVALVTGGNSGIGYATVKGLCKSFDGEVVLTALTQEDADKAVAQLKSEGCDAKGTQLDQTDAASVAALAEYMKSNYGGVDSLVCNAGINYKMAKAKLGITGDDGKPVADAVALVFDTNVKGTAAVLNAINDMLKPNGRIVIVSSMAAAFILRQASEENRARVTSPDMKTPDIIKAVNRYLDDVKSGDAVSKGWPDEEGYCYCFSAFAVAKMAAHAQEEADKKGRENLIINSCCPGMVATAMTDFKGCAPEEGAVTPVYLATLAADAKEPRGMFVKDKKAMPLTDLITLKPADLPWNK